MALYVALLITSALAFSGWMYARHMEATFKASVAAQQAVIAERLAAEVASKIEAQRHQLERFAGDIKPAEMADSGALAGRLRALGQYHPYLDDFWIADASGQVIADFPEVAGRRGTDVSSRDYFRQVRSSGKSIVSEPTVGRFSGQGRVLLFAPIFGPGGEFAGAVAGVIRLQAPRILGDLTRQKVGETGYYYVLNAAPGKTLGDLLVHPAKEGQNILSSRDADGREFIKEILEKKNGLMGLIMKESIIMDKNMELENLYGLTEVCMKVNGKMVNNMVLVNIMLLVVKVNLEYGNKVKE